MNINSKLKKGFTLIEHLVVVAIIGILTAIVFISVSTASAKGRDASIKSNMDAIRKQAEVYFTQNNSYNLSGPNLGISSVQCGAQGSGNILYYNHFLSDPIIVSALIEMNRRSQNGASRCVSFASNYVVAARLNKSTTGTGNVYSWCVDSSGYFGEVNIGPASAIQYDSLAGIYRCGMP